ncbi:MAG: SIMPL domain-containing protein, partial [Gaiellaceae bacterium]
ALRKAIVQARERAEVLAQAAGVRLARIVSIEPSYGSGSATVASAGSSTTPVLAPTQQVTASVTLVFALT